MLPSTQFAYPKGLGTCDALLCLSRALQSGLESGQEAKIVQIYFRAMSTIREFSISSALWVLEVLTYLVTLSGLEAVKNAPWPCRGGLHHLGKFQEPYNEFAGQ